MYQEIILNKNYILRTIRKIGWINIGIGLFVLAPLLLILEVKVFDPYQKYDYDEIIKKGKAQLAKITSIKEKYNTKFNGRTPKIIDYTFDIDGKTLNDKFETIDREKVEAFGSDSIQVAVWNKKSVIIGLEQANFPIRKFWLGPVMFVIIGGILVLVSSFILPKPVS